VKFVKRREAERCREVAVVKKGISVLFEPISPLTFMGGAYCVVIQTWLLSGEMFRAESKAFTV
jgi:hypothetical protein